MHCIVKKTLQKIVDTNNHYLVKVKDNQPRLLASLKPVVEKSHPIHSHTCVDKNRGRSEIRTTIIYDSASSLPLGWTTVKKIIYVRREFKSKGRIHKTDSYYISDLDSNCASFFANGIRGHWFIENMLHYVKDVVMKEDKASTKNKIAAANLALFRNIAFNILKNQNRSIKYATEFFANNNVKDLLNILIRT